MPSLDTLHFDRSREISKEMEHDERVDLSCHKRRSSSGQEKSEWIQSSSSVQSFSVFDLSEDYDDYSDSYTDDDTEDEYRVRWIMQEGEWIRVIDLS